jgi:hypothetical protein
MWLVRVDEHSLETVEHRTRAGFVLLWGPYRIRISRFAQVNRMSILGDI